MLDRLALLANRRGRRVMIAAVVLSIAAGALGAGLADRLDPGVFVRSAQVPKP